MEGVQIFSNEEFGRIRTIAINGEPWFVGKDVAEKLGYSDTKSALSDHVDFEDKDIIQRGQIATFDIPNRGLTIINESGLYSLVLSSKLPRARAFKRWVTSEVIPSIRKRGVYATPQAAEQMLKDPDVMIQALQALKAERQKRQQLEQKQKEDAPKVIFADAVAASQTSILVGDLAKLICQNGVSIGQTRLFAWMRSNGFLMSRAGISYNMPTQRAMEAGLFEIKESTFVHSDGRIGVVKTPKVTGKGQQYFINRFLKEKEGKTS